MIGCDRRGASCELAEQKSTIHYSLFPLLKLKDIVVKDLVQSRVDRHQLPFLAKRLQVTGISNNCSNMKLPKIYLRDGKETYRPTKPMERALKFL